MSTEGDGRSEDDPGWAAPTLPPRAPATGTPPPRVPVPPAPQPTASPPPSAPTSAWTPPLPGVAGAPPTGRGRAWLVVLFAVLAVTVVAAVAGTVLFIDRTLPPYQGAQDFLDDIVHGRRSAAAQRLCSIDREDPQGAIDTIEQTFGSGNAKIAVNALTVDRTENRAIVEYTVDRSGTSHDRTFKLKMRLESADWKACPL